MNTCKAQQDPKELQTGFVSGIPQLGCREYKSHERERKGCTHSAGESQQSRAQQSLGQGGHIPVEVELQHEWLQFIDSSASMLAFFYLFSWKIRKNGHVTATGGCSSHDRTHRAPAWALSVPLSPSR